MSRSSDEETLLKLVLFTAAIEAYMFGYIVYEGQLGTLFNVTIKTTPFYLVTFLISVFGVMWWKNHDNFRTEELVFYFVFAIPTAFLGTAFGFWYLTELGDIEIRNGFATKAVWEEAYYTEHYNSDKKRTERTDHSAVYKVETSNPGEYETFGYSEWMAYVNRWGGQRRVSSRRMSGADGENFDSDHDGVAEVHTIQWDNRIETRVSTAIEHRYVNYIRASDSVLKVHGAMPGYEEYLSEYPRTQNRGFGDIEVDRVISKGISLPGGFAEKVDHLLDEELCHLGARRQCNIMLYVVGCDRVGFFNALLEKWQLGKSNDIVVVIGCRNTGIEWCRVMAWTDHKAFLENLERKVRELKDINGKEAELVTTIVNQINAAGDECYLRKPMADYSYLAAEVRMAMWAQLLVVVCSCVMTMPTILLIIQD